MVDDHKSKNSHSSVAKVDKSVINYETRMHVDSHPISDFKGPDWKIYKIENTTELTNVKNRLAQLGLKDNWLRNEVWRYDKNFGYVEPRRFLLRNASSGLALGFALAVVTLMLQKGYKIVTGKSNDHNHH